MGNKRFFTMAGTAALVLAQAVPSLADVKDGVDAWSRGDYAAAVREWQGPADRGDADAQFNLGQAYKLGRGVPQDLARAEALFAKASAQGHFQAADNYGLLLFQRGERSQALPYLQGAAERGDPRAQYLLGIAHFNGDIVPRDWVRAYALATLARQGGLGQAGSAIAEMDKHIPLAQRQQGTTLAAELAAKADATRTRQFAAADLATDMPPLQPPAVHPAAPAVLAMRTADAARAEVEAPSSPPARRQPRVVGTAPADTTPADPGPAIVATPLPPALSPAPAPRMPPAPRPKSSPRAAPAPRPAVHADGAWRVQLGAFAVSGNAEGLWNRVKNRPELAGRPRLLVPAGRVTKLQAGGFATSQDAQAACRSLSAAGLSCLPVRN